MLSVNPSGVQEKIEYDQGGLKVSRTLAYGTSVAQTEISYVSPNGLVWQKVAANGLTTTYHYDPLQQLESLTTAPEARSTTLSYDSLGRVLQATTTDTGTTTWSFDAQGYLQTISDAAGQTVNFTSYDSLGRVLAQSMTAGAGLSTNQMTYDDPDVVNGLGNLTQVQMVQGSLPEWQYAFGYDAYGQTIAGTVVLNSTTYGYGATFDPMGRTRTFLYPDGSTQILAYAADGNLSTVSLLEPGQETPVPYLTYSDFTALGEFQNSQFNPNGVQVTRTFYPVNQGFGQLQTITAVSSQQNQTLFSQQYTWNQLDWITAVTDLVSAPNSQSFSYNNQPLNLNMGFLTGAQGPYGSISYEYDQIGNLTQKNATTYAYTPDTDRMASSSLGATYSFYPNGNLQSRAQDGVSWSYTYNAAGNLIGVDRTTGAGTESGVAAYDFTGRRVFQQAVGEDTTAYRVTDNFEVVDLGQGQFQYTRYIDGLSGIAVALTASGNGQQANVAAQAAKMAAQLANPESLRGWVQRLTHQALALLQAPQTEQAVILLLLTLPFALALAVALRLLLCRHQPGRETAFARRHPGLAWGAPVALCSLLLSLAPSVHADLIPGTNGPGVPEVGVLYFVQDHLGSTVSVTDGNGNVTASLAYLPYGAVDPARSSGTDNFRPKFTNKPFNAGTLLYDFGARSYDPQVGRFITPDPDHQFISPYLYGNDSPASYVDPNGDFAFLTAMTVGAVVGAYLGAAAVNHSFNPLNWDWKSGKTYAGLFAGAAIGAIGAAAGGLVAEAAVAVGAIGGMAAEAASVAVGIAGQALVGAGESAAFTALGGGSSEDVFKAAVQGAFLGGLTAGIGRAASSFGRSTRGAASELLDGESTSARGAGSNCCGCASFVAGTPVLLGDEARPIETLAQGEQLVGHDFDTQRNQPYPIVATHTRKVQETVTIELADGEVIITTPEHPFWVLQRGWIPARHLDAGDQLTSDLGQPIALTRVATSVLTQPVAVFNFTVDEVHNYYVGTAHVLVKNVGVCPQMREMDQRRGLIDRNDRYVLNPTRTQLSRDNVVAGQIRVNGQAASGRYMYVVDNQGRISIGTRAGGYPHPTLVGGQDPQVRAAGIVELRRGRIYSVDSHSGHFRPPDDSLYDARDAFNALDATYHEDFQGYLTWTGDVLLDN